jgi:AcrR family transcriptional regulator
MPNKRSKKQLVVRRSPQQARSQNKVELILEAVTRLIEREGIEALTTNAMAERAGISIGTLYQYFDNKEAVLQALMQRELKGLSERVLEAVKRAPPVAMGGRVPAIVRAVLSSYGGRRRVHRLLLERALSRGAGTRLNSFYKGLIESFATDGVAPAGLPSNPMKPADAFVLTHALAGVMRATVATENSQIPQHYLEESLTRLVVCFYRSTTS